MALKQLIAITDIQLMVEPGRNADREKGIAARPPKTRSISTGSHFKAKDEAQQKELVDRLKCAVYADAGEPPVAATTSTEPTGTEPDPAPKKAGRPKKADAETKAEPAAKSDEPAAKDDDDGAGMV